MLTLLDLKPGNEIRVYMRQSVSLETGRRPDGSEYRYVPGRPQRYATRGLSRFNATVVANDVATHIITLNTVGINSKGIPLGNSPNLRAEVHYTTFSRVFLFSEINFEPRPEDRRTGTTFRPTTAAIGTNFKPYRTLTLVHIPQNIPQLE